MRNNGRHTYKRGDVVYVDHLHTDKSNLIRYDPHPDKDGRTWCRVEGKARRMLILRRCWRLLVDTAHTDEPSDPKRCVWYRVETQVAYWVLSLQSEAPPGQHEPLRIEVDRGKTSYVVHAPLCYPAKSVSHGPNQHVHSVEDWMLGEIEKAVGLHKLGLPDNYRA